MTAVEPSLGVESFSCPHCGALAHQTWNRLGLLNFNKQRPAKISYEQVAKIPADGDDDGKKWRAFVDRIEKNVLTYWYESYQTTDWVFVNLFTSECWSCKGYAVWVEDRIVYPVKDVVVSANEAMPGNVKADFEEAASIVNKSPRGAAALLRLCVQKLMVHLDEPGKNLNADIASQVRKGLDVEVQQALDVVRVVGNNAVHPGQIDLKDDKATAMTLFELVNLIVDRRIAQPEKLKALFGNLPSGALEEIRKRDAPKEGDS